MTQQPLFRMILLGAEQSIDKYYAVKFWANQDNFCVEMRGIEQAIEAAIVVFV